MIKTTALDEYFRLPKGAVITCPNPQCPEPTIARTVKDITPGVGLSSDLFDDTVGQGLRVDKKTKCKACGHYWYISTDNLNRIHTGRGWFPSEDQIDQGTKRAVSA